MITREQIGNVLDHPIEDADGHKVGTPRSVYYDDRTGSPEWVTVKTGGVLGGHESFVPLHDAQADGDHVTVPYAKDTIREAPDVAVEDGHLSEDEEHRLYDHYGLDWDRAWAEANGPGEEGWARDDRHAAEGMGTAVGADAAAADSDADVDYSADVGTTAAPNAALAATDATTGDAATTEIVERTMTLSEERLRVGVERHEAGRAHLHRSVVAEDAEETVSLRHDEAHLEREPIAEADRAALADRPLGEADIEMPLYEEQAVARTETVPVEQVRLVTEERVEPRTVHATVRHERVETDGVPDDRPDA